MQLQIIKTKVKLQHPRN